MKILVTGCNGQLGNEMQLLEAEHPQHTYFNTDVAELDITDQQAVEAFVSDNEIDGIVNCAAYTAVDKAEENQEFCTTLNTVAPAYLAAAFRFQQTMCLTAPTIPLMWRQILCAPIVLMAVPNWLVKKRL